MPVETQHIVNMLDAKDGVVAPTTGVWGLIAFAAMVAGACVYMAWKLPGREDHDAGDS
jgi:hypothetical protein